MQARFWRAAGAVSGRGGGGAGGRGQLGPGLRPGALPGGLHQVLYCTVLYCTALYCTVQGGELQGLDPGAGAGGPHLCCLDGLRVTLNIIVKCTDNRYNYNDNTITLASANFIVTYLDDVSPELSIIKL